jgi:hypothetical protein
MLAGAVLAGASMLTAGIMAQAFGATSLASLSIGQGAMIGAATGAMQGFGMGMVTGWAGGKGDVGDMLESGASGALWGAAIGAVTGAATTAIAKGIESSRQASRVITEKAETALSVDNKPVVSPLDPEPGTGAGYTKNIGVEGQPTWDYLNPRVGAKLYRVYDNRAYGRSWTPIDPRTVPDYAAQSGMYNKGRFFIEGTLKDVSGVVSKSADPGPYGSGGLTEWVIPNSKTQVRVDRVYGLNPEIGKQ